MMILYSVIVGIIGGFFWGKTIGISLLVSLLGGGGIGIVVGTIVSLLGVAARAGRNLQKGETSFVNNSIITIFAVFIIGTGIIAWIVRVIFF